MGTMIQTAADAVRQLDRLAARTAQNMKAVNRKQGLRPSERAMWLADLQADIDALKFVISVFNGGPLTHVLDEVVDGK